MRDKESDTRRSAAREVPAKIVKVNGVETDRIKVNKSTYKGTNRVVTYGTAGDPTLSENLRAAIAAQDEALADANIAAAVPAQ